MNAMRWIHRAAVLAVATAALLSLPTDAATTTAGSGSAASATVTKPTTTTTAAPAKSSTTFIDFRSVNGKLLANNEAFYIKGINWFGFGTHECEHMSLNP